MKSTMTHFTASLITETGQRCHAHAPHLAALLESGTADLAELDPQYELATLLESCRDSCHEADESSVMRILRQTKRRAQLLIALAELSGLWLVETSMEAMSDVADCALHCALGHLLRKAAERGQIGLDSEDIFAHCGVSLLAVGKLGSRELNYSSDIDLLCFYDPEVAPLAKPDEAGSFYTRLMRDLVRLLEMRDADGMVFRTDFRLRPDPAATPLAVSVAAAESYYSALAQNWERAAMIRARVICGDARVAQDITELFSRWIWRRHLDYAALADIHSIKRQIHEARGQRIQIIAGHDLKLGRGGIREIEFFCQTQQLIHGGRNPELRVAAILPALESLCAAGLIEPETRDELQAAYRFLRRAEHAVQMQEDRQTHSLPKDISGIAHLLGYAEADDFSHTLAAHLSCVADHYACLFEDAPSLAGTEGLPGNLVFTGPDPDPETLKTLDLMGFGNPLLVIQHVSNWHRGRYRATRSARAREILTALVPALLANMAKTVDPDQSLLRFDQLLSRLPSGISFFSLLQAQPAVLGILMEILGTAPLLGEILARQPHLLDALIGEAGQLPAQESLAQARDYEDQLNRLRLWAAEGRFLAGLDLLCGQADMPRHGKAVSYIADEALTALCPLVQADYARHHGQFSKTETGLLVLALGKYGGREVSISSDLDLVFLYDPAVGEKSDGAKPHSPAVYYNRLAQRLLSAITAPLQEGRLWDVDTRLRPEGHSGALAVSLEAFRHYYAGAAWVWEHMALHRARIVTGSPQMMQKMQALLDEIRSHPMERPRLREGYVDIRAKATAHLKPQDIWQIKTWPGGLLEIEWAIQALCCLHGISGATSIQDQARLLAQRGAAHASALAEIHQLFLTLQSLHRLQGVSLTPALLWEDWHGLDRDRLAQHLMKMAKESQNLIEQIIKEI